MSKRIDMETRIKEATELADTAFWKTVAECFPEAKTGDFTPDFVYNPEPLVRHWVNINVPMAVEPWAEALDLRNAASWHLLNTGGGVMVAVTEPIKNGWYLGVSGEHVILYQKRSSHWFEERSEIGIWVFGDDPTKLMALINKYFSGVFNPYSLFDDIMTVGKSDKVS